MAKKTKKIKKTKTKARPKTKSKAKKIVVPHNMPKPVGKVTHFFGGIKVAIVKFKKPVKVGAVLYFKGATTDFSQTVDSMQFNHQPIKTAKPNTQVGLKVSKRVREGDEVFMEK
ncbi:MAG TPA: translation elongation factor-like protein [Candidatus Paceibacterota bacterium]